MNVQVTTVVMLLLLAGIALIGVGLQTLLAPNVRTQQLGVYSAAIAAYTTGGIASHFTATSLTVVGSTWSVPLTPLVIPYSFSGDQDSVPPSTVNILHEWTAMVPTQDTPYTIQVSQGGTRQSDIVLPAMNPALPWGFAINCTDKQEDDKGCSILFLQQQCVQISQANNGQFVPATDLVSGRCPPYTIDCGFCGGFSYLKARCDYITWDAASNSWDLETGAIGCVYPFTMQIYNLTVTAPYPQLNITVRPYEEPYNTAQNQTQGFMDFGDTVETQRKAGLAALATGVAMVLVCVVGVFLSKVVLANIKRKKQLKTLASMHHTGSSQEMSEMTESTGKKGSSGRGSHNNSGRGSDKGSGGRRGSDGGDSGGGGNNGRNNSNNNTNNHNDSRNGRRNSGDKGGGDDDDNDDHANASPPQRGAKGSSRQKNYSGRGRENDDGDDAAGAVGPKTGGRSSWSQPAEWQRGRQNQNGGGSNGNSGNNSETGSGRGGGRKSSKNRNYAAASGGSGNNSGRASDNEAPAAAPAARQKRGGGNNRNGNAAEPSFHAAAGSSSNKYNREEIAKLVSSKAAASSPSAPGTVKRTPAAAAAAAAPARSGAGGKFSKKKFDDDDL